MYVASNQYRRIRVDMQFFYWDNVHENDSCLQNTRKQEMFTDISNLIFLFLCTEINFGNCVADVLTQISIGIRQESVIL